MGGYRDYPEEDQPIDRATGTSWWKVMLFTCIYMIPLFWLWNSTDFPDSLGVHISAHGKAGLIENWYYSYLLLRRHDALDVLTFIYMWSVVAGFLSWIGFKSMRRKGPREP